MVFLAIDDDIDDLDILRQAVKEVDSRIFFIPKQNAREALEALKLMRIPVPNLIYLDMNMPRLNGKECLIEIKKSKRLSSIPVVIYSTQLSLQLQAELKNLGATLCLEKPTEFQTICDLLRRCVNQFYRGFNRQTAPG